LCRGTGNRSAPRLELQHEGVEVIRIHEPAGIEVSPGISRIERGDEGADDCDLTADLSKALVSLQVLEVDT
jgi:hypothetical protein